MPFSTLVSTQLLAEHLADPDWVVFDCRFVLADPGAGERAYREGHIPGARYVHLERDLSSSITATSGRHPLPDPQALARRLSAWGVGEGTQVVVYDDASGAMAGRMWWLLRWLGHKRVALLDGGITLWLREERPLSTELREPAPRAFPAHADNTQWLDTQQVQEGLGAGALRLLDARGEARFSGRGRTHRPRGRPCPRRTQPAVSAQPRLGRTVSAIRSIAA